MTGCGHTRHVGTCPECQRAQLARWRYQLEEASKRAYVSGPPVRGSDLQWNHADATATDLSATPMTV
jgi:hypothetical protein